jgi:Lrp/AsnC family leucine-responsive transcriptional regulator
MGALTAYAATIGRAMFDCLFEGWAMLTLSSRVPSAMALLAKTLAGSEIVVEAYELAGGCDVLVHVVASELSEWSRLERVVEKNVGALADVRVGIATRLIKPPSPWPIARLLGRHLRHTKDSQR